MWVRGHARQGREGGGAGAAVGDGLELEVGAAGEGGVADGGVVPVLLDMAMAALRLLLRKCRWRTTRRRRGQGLPRTIHLHKGEGKGRRQSCWRMSQVRRQGVLQ